MWVYAHNGHKIGPVEFDEIVNQIKAGVIVETTPVCSSGEKPCRAGQHPKLKQFFAAINNSPEPQNVPSNSPAFQFTLPSTPKPQFSFPSASETKATPSNEAAASRSETAIPDFSQSSSSKPSSGRKNFKRHSGTRKKAANSNQMMIIGAAAAVIVVVIGLIFITGGGSGSSGLSNLVTSKAPKTVTFTDDDTVDNLRPKAESGNMKAQFKLGMLLHNDDSVEWYRKAAANGYAPAQVYCYISLMREDEDEAERWLKKAADQKYPSALSLCYAKGIGFEPDKDKARKTLVNAAERGDSIAQTLLGMFYINTMSDLLGVSKDSYKSRYWLRQAAEQGIPDAQGTLYDKFGEKKWGYKLAKKVNVELQVSYAVKVLNEFSLNFNTNSEDQAEFDEAMVLLKNCAQNNNAKAQYELGRLYFHGVFGFPMDRDTAYTWMKKAADNGDRDAQQFLREEF
ncbi:MAG: SEL1-like repeat protein [Thermoguttaceae bacterium]|nr:SEL1-like repeat protein [Thermoguttaceae bacterium]